MNKLQIIKKELASEKVQNRLAMTLGLDQKNEIQLQKIQGYISSVYYEIEKTSHDPKRDLTKCTIESITQAMIDAAKFGLYIDGRQHAYLVKYGNRVDMQIGYRGYLFKVAEYYENVSYSATPVFEGDELTVKNEHGNQEYTHIPKDPFEDSWEKLRGIVFGITYTVDGVEKKNVERVSKADLLKIRKKAKFDSIWKEWPIEKAKGAAAKRACKIIFAGIPEVQDMINYDNEKHYEKIITPEESVLDSINQVITHDLLEDKTETNNGSDD